MTAEHGLQQITERDQIGERLCARFELDDQVNIAVRTRGVMPDRAKQGKPSNPQADDFGLGGPQAGLDVRAGRGRGNHNLKLAHGDVFATLASSVHASGAYTDEAAVAAQFGMTC